MQPTRVRWIESSKYRKALIYTQGSVEVIVYWSDIAEHSRVIQR